MEGDNMLYKNWVDVIKCFEGEQARKYWVSRLPVCDSVKGYILSILFPTDTQIQEWSREVYLETTHKNIDHNMEDCV